jgi:hypothetical protein
MAVGLFTLFTFVQHPKVLVEHFLLDHTYHAAIAIGYNQELIT